MGGLQAADGQDDGAGDGAEQHVKLGCGADPTSAEHIRVHGLRNAHIGDSSDETVRYFLDPVPYDAFSEAVQP